MPKTWSIRLLGKRRLRPLKPLRPEQNLIWLFIAAVTLSLVLVVGCTPKALIIQPTPVKEPVTSNPMQPPEPEGYFSHRLREILGIN